MNIKFNKDIFILGIESSCDDTSIGVSKNMSVLSNIVSNQKIHKKYGGVVPELASREHQKNIIPTLQEALKRSCKRRLKRNLMRRFTRSCYKKLCKKLQKEALR